MGMARLWDLNRRQRERERVLKEAPVADRPWPVLAGASSSTPKRLADYRTLADIRDRLAVLYDKADRMQRFLDSGCTAAYVLDVKQVTVVALFIGSDLLERKCRRYFLTLRRTIDVLESRRSQPVRANRKARGRAERRRLAA